MSQLPVKLYSTSRESKVSLPYTLKFFLLFLERLKVPFPGGEGFYYSSPRLHSPPVPQKNRRVYKTGGCKVWREWQEAPKIVKRLSTVIGSCPNQLFAWTLAGSIYLRWVIKRLILTCRRRDESSSLLLQVNEPFYDSPQMYRTSQSSFKELIWARPY